jgi:deoxyadenosine/deoxycytidine kinase
MSTRPKVIVVDGNIAVGKTTWIQIITKRLREEGLRVSVVLEPVVEWQKCGILQKFYKNERKYAYSFQTYVVVTRLKSIIEAHKEHGDNVDFYLLERSCFTDEIFAQVNHNHGNISIIEYELYKAWSEFHKQFMPFEIDCHVYLSCEPDLCYHRCMERDREGESGISIDYLRVLSRAHDSYFNGKPNVFKYDTVPNYIDNLDLQDNMFEEFKAFVSTC